MKSKIKYYDVIDFDERVSILSKDLIEKYHLSQGLMIPDAIIAATAVVHDLKLFTYNLKDFKFIPKIRFYEGLKK